MNAPSKTTFEVRELHTVDEFIAVEQIQYQVWGTNIIPDNKELFVAIQNEGALIAGAFAPGAGLVAYIFAYPTRDPNAQHSHRLAVLKEWRSHGVGLLLKCYQRDWCLERGIDLVRWTFDPLRTINADLNLRRLGAVVSKYLLNFYGPLSGIDAGAPSDRFLMEWHLRDPRVIDRLAHPSTVQLYEDAPAANRIVNNRPVETHLGLTAPFILIHLPDDFVKVIAEQPELAVEWRMHFRSLLAHYFKEGYQITDFTRAGGAAYVLEHNQQ